MIKKIIVVLVAIFGLGVFSSSAQSLKLGYVDYIKVLDSLPSKLKADKDLQDFLEGGQKTISEMQISFEEEYTVYMAEKDSLAPLIQEMREKNLMEQQQLIQYKSESLEQDLQVLNERLYKPIEENLNKAIENIAVKYKLTYVLEKSTVLYTADDALEITKEVKAELMRLDKAQ